MNDFQTRTTRLLEELRAEMRTSIDEVLKPRLRTSSFQSVIGLSELNSSQKITLMYIIERHNSGLKTHTSQDLRQVLPYSRVMTSRYIKHLLECGFISIIRNGVYELNEKAIY